MLDKVRSKSIINTLDGSYAAASVATVATGGVEARLEATDGLGEGADG